MIKTEVKGLKELEQALVGLGQKIAVKVLRDAGKEAMEIVAEDMEENSGFNIKSQSAHMRDSIGVRARNRMSDQRWPTVVTIRVGPSKAHGQKAIAQEFGTIKQVAKPFMRPALDYNRPKILRILTTRIREGIADNR